ncbi:MAG: hypothetical protein COX70_03025 [Flavobacteriales bacterium CG_4_10_14_0_2_um_filter_32_8]|nr:MAG: hypothetical protein COX70_03025 [Flavobacteriales bacterium CG_4_10_14_0_2_um_filter_32_8]PJB14953.1 MAG: hypothetical protein CO118_05880 [Flavobacteriales bacterium CG_4_9_14_3_um_filter_32_8]
MAHINGQDFQCGDCIDLTPHKIEFSSEIINYGLIIGNTNKKPQILFNDALLQFSYVTDIDTIWNNFIVPINFISFTSTASINLDNIGREELLIKGLVKFNNGIDTTIQKVLLVFNIDSIPTQICKIIYGCIPLTLYNEATYSIWDDDENCSSSIVMDGLVISIEKKNKNSERLCCDSNFIVAGKYIMESGQIKQLK